MKSPPPVVQQFDGKIEARGAEGAGKAHRPAPLFVGRPPGFRRPLIGRDEELAALRSTVCSGGAAAITALNGLPGVGKTALATALVHDPEVCAHFAGGVFWVGLGRTPNVESALGIWAGLTGGWGSMGYALPFFFPLSRSALRLSSAGRPRRASLSRNSPRVMP
jgi:hypothetical protein